MRQQRAVALGRRYLTAAMVVPTGTVAFSTLVFRPQASAGKGFSHFGVPCDSRRQTVERRKTLTPVAEIGGGYQLPVAPLARNHVSTVIWEK